MDGVTARAFGSPKRYIQGYGEFDRLPLYSDTFGKKVYFLVDPFLMEKYEARISRLYGNTTAELLIDRFAGECCGSEIARSMARAEDMGADVVIGVGGGKTLDTLKMVSDRLRLPRILAPTSASNDAPASGMSVLYTDSGEHIGSVKQKTDSDIVLVDTQIIVGAPIRLTVAGMGDALATYVEARASMASGRPNYIDGGYAKTRAGLAMARLSYDILFESGAKAKSDIIEGKCTQAVEDVIEADVLLSGLGFENTGCALAHGIDAGLTHVPNKKKTLHGENVAFGILCELCLEKAPEEELSMTAGLMAELGLPLTLDFFGIEPSKEGVSVIAKKAFATPTIKNEPAGTTEEEVLNSILEAHWFGKKFEREAQI